MFHMLCQGYGYEARADVVAEPAFLCLRIWPGTLFDPQKHVFAGVLLRSPSWHLGIHLSFKHQAQHPEDPKPTNPQKTQAQNPKQIQSLNPPPPAPKEHTPKSPERPKKAPKENSPTRQAPQQTQKALQKFPRTPGLSGPATPQRRSLCPGAFGGLRLVVEGCCFAGKSLCLSCFGFRVFGFGVLGFGALGLGLRFGVQGLGCGVGVWGWCVGFVVLGYFPKSSPTVGPTPAPIWEAQPRTRHSKWLGTKNAEADRFVSNDGFGVYRG